MFRKCIGKHRGELPKQGGQVFILHSLLSSVKNEDLTLMFFYQAVQLTEECHIPKEFLLQVKRELA